MIGKFAVIDVETPNRNNDAICSIGIVILENGRIIDTKYYLVNPETYFDEQNIRIHGITEQAVMNAPNFLGLWPFIKGYFCEYLLVGHNLGFDLSSIKKAMDCYGIVAPPAYYIDTLSISRKYDNYVSDHKLNTLCACYNISLKNHHNALCDCISTAELLMCLFRRYRFDPDDFIRVYSFEKTDNYTFTPHYTDSTKSLIELQGVLYGITCDNVLTDYEILSLRNWVQNHKELIGNYPYDKIYNSIEDILADGVITDSERIGLQSIISKILNPVEKAENIVQFMPDGSTVCLSGDFETMSKADFSKLLASKGAIIKNSVTKALNYLVVGSLGSEQWAHGNYGTKIKKAMEYNEQGCCIQIIKEEDILPLLFDD